MLLLLSDIERQSLIKRIQNNIEEVPAPYDWLSEPCWIWKGSIGHNHGYGQLFFHNEYWLLHRLSYLIFNGEITEDKPCVLHHCDMKHCCQFTHLWTGTYQDNTDDSIKKGRRPIYVQKIKPVNILKTLRDNTKRQMFILEEQGLSQRDISKLLNVHYSTVSYTLSGKRSPHIYKEFI